MAKMRMDEIEPSGKQSRGRAEAEDEAQNALYDGRKRFKSVGKTKAIIFRTTEEKRAQILRLADALGLGQPKPISIAETIEKAIDALEEKLKGAKR